MQPRRRNAGDQRLRDAANGEQRSRCVGVRAGADSGSARSKFPVIPTVNHPAASSQIDVLAQCNSFSLPRGSKRKFDGLSLGLGNSSSSESSKQSMGTGCTISSSKGSDDGSSTDLSLNYFTLGNEGISSLDKRAYDPGRALGKAGLNLELSLSSQSAITGTDFTAATEHNSPIVQPYIMNLVPAVDEGSTSARRPSGAPAPTLPQLPKSPLMAVVVVAAMKDAEEQQEENLAAVLNMVVAKGVNMRTVQRVQKGAQACVLPMEVGTAASMLVAEKVLKVALISARLMVVARDAHTLIVPRVPREVHHSARAMEEANAVQLKVVQRVCMVEPNAVLPMEAGSVVWY
ncbi:hypothetical protein GUJ93_ZPchr0002g23109 [Zizania palustris]|uniref:Uncharacterized protein n=1 Tax=Zizania palustris TaxID=103762 RepID=A0A8J5RUZ1_ZIZPA|nr:hypothetical protein GUJ93_ZPchr0002g23109 [Zizania palustris]